MTDKQLLHEILDMARDGGYSLDEIWGALRGRYAISDEQSMRRQVRAAVGQLIDSGYVSLSHRVGPGQYRQLESSELRGLNESERGWGIGEDTPEPNLNVSATPKGVAALGRGEFNS